MVERYDVGSYNQQVTINIDDLITKHKQFGRNSRLLNKVILVAIDNAIDDLRERTVEKMKENMGRYGLSSGTLYNNITVDRLDSGFYITTKGENTWGYDYAMSVEFGTGIVGSGSPHPKIAESGWVYDVNQHGDYGWIYPTTSDDPNPTKYVGKDGQYYAWTAGTESRPFMYDTWLWLSRTWNNVIRGYINRALKEWGEDLV